MKNIRYSQPYIDGSDIKSVSKSLKSLNISDGPITKKLEEKLKKNFKLNHVLIVSNASNALMLGVKGLNLKKNDIVWTSNITFCSNINSALHFGCKVKLIDTNEKFPFIDYNNLKDKLRKTSKKKLPKLIIVTHMGGFAFEMKKIQMLSKIYKFKLIEDASHALGSKHDDNNYVGSKYSDICVFSSHAVKTITSGEGGILSIKSKKIFNKIKELKTHSIIRGIGNKNPKIYDVNDLGFNFRITDFQSALLLSQLSKIKKFKKLRLNRLYLYLTNLSKKHFDIPDCYFKKSKFSSLHLFIVYLKVKFIPYRNQLMKYLLSKGIETNIHYIPNSSHSFYKKNTNVNFELKELKNSNDYYQKCLTLPLHPNLSNKDILFIIKSIKNFFNDKNL